MIMQICLGEMQDNDAAAECVRFFQQLMKVNDQILPQNQEYVMECLLSQEHKVLQRLAFIGVLSCLCATACICACDWRPDLRETTT